MYLNTVFRYNVFKYCPALIFADKMKKNHTNLFTPSLFTFSIYEIIYAALFKANIQTMSEQPTVMLPNPCHRRQFCRKSPKNEATAANFIGK